MNDYMLKNSRVIDGERLYLFNDRDTLVFNPDEHPLVDATGLPLAVNDLVAWGTGYRGGTGVVVGQVVEVSWTEENYSAFLLDDEGPYVTEPHEQTMWDKTVRMTTRNVTRKRTKWVCRIRVTPLTSGRKGRTETSGEFFAKIANQAFQVAA